MLRTIFGKVTGAARAAPSIVPSLRGYATNLYSKVRKAMKDAVNNDQYPALNQKRTGLWLNPIESLVFFGTISLTVSMVLVLTIQSSGVQMSRNGTLGLILMFFVLSWIKPEVRRATNYHVLVLKVFGLLVPVYLETGRHILPFAWFILSTNRDAALGPVIDSQEGNEDDPGQVYVGVLTVRLDNEDGDPKMTALASDNGQVRFRPTFRHKCINPMRRLKQSKPIQDLNEACRDTARQAISGTTTAPQTNQVHGALKAAIAGATIYFVRTRRSNPDRGVHGGDLVIHRASRRPIFAIGIAGGEDQILKGELLKLVKEQGKLSMLDAASAIEEEVVEKDEKMVKVKTPNHDTIEVTSLNVGAQLIRAYQDNGYMLEALPRIGEVDAPEPVVTASGKAGAEVPQRQAALADAETARQTAEVLEKDKGLDNATATLAGLALGNPNIKIIHQPGSGGNGVIVNAS